MELSPTNEHWHGNGTANANGNTLDAHIKREPPSTSTSLYSLPSPSHKRTRSDNAQEVSEKRQRIETNVSSDALADILRGVSASVQQEYRQQREPGQGGSQNTSRDDSVQSHGFTSDPYLSMRILSLPVLDSLSTQILSTLARGSHLETVNIVTNPESEFGQAYAALRSLFDDTKKIYSQRGQGFLSADDLGINEPKHRAIIRITNVASFAASIFGGQEIGFYQLNDHFIDIFTPEDQPLSVDAGELHINLKTQMYLSSLMQEEQNQTKEDILEELFPLALDEIVAGRHPSMALTQNEMAFLDACRARREFLMKEPSDVESIQVLSESFPWEDFLRDLSGHLNRAYEPIVDPYMKRHALTAPKPGSVRNGADGQFGTQIATTPLTSNGTAAHHDQAPGNNNSVHQLNEGSQKYHKGAQNGYPQSKYSKSSIPYPTQSAPTQVLYEKARQAAVAKSHPGTTRRPGLPSQRRPWSTEEENTLMTGLDQVKGPHWSHILGLYGPSGSINQILKDRNQVQLKDKARNLKLFFLKSNIEVPYYLSSVTGELKTRAPSQAARKEAEERARLAGEDEKARAATIMALASHMQSSPRVGSDPEPDSQENFSLPDEQLLVTEPNHQVGC